MKDNVNFVSIDLETATSDRSSICQIGITVVERGEITKSRSWLVRPEDNEYDSWNSWIHGITPSKTKDSPSFPEVWPKVQPYLQNKIVVAHNTSFDMYALRDALDAASIEYPTFDYFCSLRLSKKLVKGCCSYTLPCVLDHLGIEFEGHHNAKKDSLGCAKLMVKCLELAECGFDEIEEKYSFSRGKFYPGGFKAQLAKDKSGGSYMKEFLDNLKGDPDKYDEGSYFFGKTVCFTGTFQYGTRKDLLTKIANIGGIPTNSVTAKTDILVVGEQDYRVVGEDGMSNKQEKALDMIAKGKEIEILSESDFLSMI